MYTLTRSHLRCSAAPPPTPVPPQLPPPSRLLSPPHIFHDPTLCSTRTHRASVAAGSTSILTDLARSQLRCSATPATAPPPTPVPSQLAPPSRPVSPPHIFHDPTLCSTWPHRAWVAAGSTSVLTALARSLTTESPLSSLLAALLAYALADLSTGVYHWAIDNYGGPHTPLFGPQIAAFQGHHRRPSTITRRHFANNLHALARVVALTVGPIELAAAASGSSGDATLHAFVGAFAGCVMMSQQFHAWAHTNKRRLPAVVAALHEVGVLISTARHAAHHRAPYNNNYCIVSGMWNGWLDEMKVFEAAEMVVFSRFGVRPRSWSEPGTEWTEEGGAEASTAVSAVREGNRLG